MRSGRISFRRSPSYKETVSSKKRLLIYASVSLLIPAVSFAAEIKTYRAVRADLDPPVVDGRGEDPAWARVPWDEGFVQNSPFEGRAPSQRTAFKILYDERNLYALIRADDSEPRRIDRRVTRRDDQTANRFQTSGIPDYEKSTEYLSVFLDTYHDHRTVYMLRVTAAGVKTDAVLANDEVNPDYNWNPVWRVRTAVDEQGWTAEMRIPLNQLRFGKDEEQVWGLQVERCIYRSQELCRWQLMPIEAKGFASLFGHLEGIRDARASSRIEILPYTVGKAETFQPEAGNPFVTGRRQGLSGGVDAKIGMGNKLTLDLTANPDFGQVEADPSVINLTAFETYFQEKRPFFTEGSNILSFKLAKLGSSSLDTLFYSRRIGQAPHGSVSSNADYVDMPQSSSILGAFKLTGKTKSGWSIGILDGLTAAEKAGVEFQGRRRYEPVEPLTNYFAGRVQKDYADGNTVVGAMVTATNRSITSSELEFLHRAAYAGGLDLLRYWKNKSYYFSLNAVFSQVRGSEEAILRTQQAPARYFQRPDAGYLTLDPNRTSLGGTGGTLEFGKSGGGHFRYLVNLIWRSPGLELNDVGFLREADIIRSWQQVNYVVWKPFAVFREVSVTLSHWWNWNYGGEKKMDGGEFIFIATFRNNWTWYSYLSRDTLELSASQLRGGPSLLLPGNWLYYGQIATNRNKKFQFRLFAGAYQGDQNYYQSPNFSFGVTYRPLNALEVSFGPDYWWNRNKLQYVTTQEFGDEKRYICADIYQKTFSLTLRLNWCVTPDLSIQYYGQPYCSVGRYSNLKRVIDPRAVKLEDKYHLFTGMEISRGASGDYLIDENMDGLTDYTVGNPDFSFPQFRSNLVLRWEYKPGSSLYVVWSQGRTGNPSAANFSLLNRMGDLFNIYPWNVFLIKWCHWFSM